MDRLLAIGFFKVGNWTLEADGLCLNLTDLASAQNILYAFVSNQRVLYVGKTIRSLKQRLYGYQNPGPTQRTNIKGRESLVELLNAGHSVDIYALPDSGLLHYGGFHVNLAAGLEDSIVSQLKPEWNRTGV